MIVIGNIDFRQWFPICPIRGRLAPEWGKTCRRPKVRRFAGFVSKQTHNRIYPFDNPNRRR
jgi:hypothetical protein